MTCCNHCQDSQVLFSDRTARRDLKRYRRRGPMKTTRRLIDAIRPRVREGWTLLDVGGGIGAIQHELLEAGASHATQVDASPAYLEASREEAARRGNAERTEHRYADFTDVAGEIPEADVVTLDRVICCYPDMERLVTASAAKARHVYGLVFPRERRLTRVLLALGNLYMRMRRSAFRTFVHSTAAVEATLRAAGFERVTYERTAIWQVSTWTRT